MADKKDPSAPKSRVKPGTPSKLLKGKVFGYHGKYVWKATFDAQTKARNAAKKGSALAKRTSTSIVRATRATLAKAPKGKIIPINKTDSAVVKAAKRAYNAGNRTRSIVNKIYKAGQTTRKNVETVYKAGKEARKVHDKVVKGGKEFVKGAYEGGKDTKRAVNRLKPGGKLVKSKGGAVTKYTKKPTSVVKTKGSKIMPYTETSKGKLVRRGKVTPTSPKKTPKTPESPRRISAKLRIQQAEKGVTKDTEFNKKHKVKGSSTNPWKTNKKGQITNAYDWRKAKQFANKTLQKGVNLAKSPKVSRLAKGVGKVGGVVEKVTLPLALIRQTGQHINQLKNLGVVPGSGNFGKRLTYDQKNVRDTGNPIHNRLYEVKKKRLAKEDAKKRSDERKVKETKTVNNNNKKVTIKNVTKGNKPKTYWNAENVPQYDGKSSTTKTKETESNKAKVLNKLQAKKTPDSVGNMKGAIPSKPKKKYTARDRMRARNEAIHGKDRNDRVYEYNKAWQKARKAGKLKEFKKKYPSVRSWKLPKK